MTKRSEKDLIERYLKNECTPYEKRLVEGWYLHNATQTEWEQLPVDAFLRAEKKLKRELHFIQRAERTGRSVWLAAASIIFVLGFGLFLYQNNRENQLVNTTKEVNTSITPGGNYAVLILANGEHIPLKGREIAKTAMGLLTISSVKDGHIKIIPTVNDNSSSGMNRIETPAGGQFEITMEDGSHIWLNSKTSISFPTSFAKNTRQISLKGEAYFEIAKDKHRPFIVSTPQNKIEVLGTHFNVRAYEDEVATKTTLLEGRVRITEQATGEVTILEPSQEATNIKHRLTVTNTITDAAVAWKNGYFDFNNKTLETSLSELARWYQVDVAFKNNAIKELPLAGTISRYSSISQILDKIALTGMMKFHINNRTIIVE